MIELISRLPQGYQEVEYIESSGTQYIDTGYKPTGENMRLVIDYMYSTSPNGKSLFGAESSATFPITFYSRSATTAEFYIGSTYNAVSYNITTGTRYKLDCHANNGAFTANLNETAKSETYSGSLLKTLNLFLFTNNGQQSTQLISARLYSCQIYDNEILIRDFVPCCRKADNVAGLYDLVNNVFYTNAGSGVFAVGSNTGEIVITPGGVISFSAALRRRMMMSGVKKMWTITSDHTPQDYHSINAWTKVSVGDVTLGDGTYTFPDGTNIVCWADANLHNKKRIKIVVDGVVVAAGTEYGPAVTYNYTLQSNCHIRRNVDTYGPGGQIFITTI